MKETRADTRTALLQASGLLNLRCKDFRFDVAFAPFDLDRAASFRLGSLLLKRTDLVTDLIQLPGKSRVLQPDKRIAFFYDSPNRSQDRFNLGVEGDTEDRDSCRELS